MDFDFLKLKFDEHLNSQGETVNIAGYEYKRNEILEGLDPIAYQDVFNEWVTDRQQQLIQKADEILAFSDNHDCYDQMFQSYKKGNLIPFVGAGFSKSSDYPMWSEFLYSCCSKSHVTKEQIDDLLNNGEYEQAAQKLYDDMSAPLFNKRLSQTYGALKEPSGPIWYLPYMFRDKHIITTNFDTLLERVFSTVCPNNFQVKTGKDISEILSIIQGSPNLIIKIHGTWEHLHNRVLLQHEYDQAYSNQGDVNDFFEKCIFKESLLFLGSSLNVDRTILKMRQYAQEKGHHKLPDHYAFMENKDGLDLASRAKELAQANIFPIWYPKEEHDDSNEALLYRMIKDNE